MAFGQLPPSAAWRHEDTEVGLESVFLLRTAGAHTLEGFTTAVDGGHAWVVHYVIAVDQDWRTQSARVTRWTHAGRREVVLEADGAGRWRVNGAAAPELDDCLDVDLESSACTNTLPVHRLDLDVGYGADAPAAYVRTLDLGVERLEQRYVRVDDDDNYRQYDYRAPVFDFEARLVYDAAGLVVHYPGIARRVL